jgi:diacylglycerol O-acyltransferase
MKQLTGSDTMFLHLDNSRVSSGFTIVLTYDIKTRADKKAPSYQEILAHLDQRLHSELVLRSKLHKVPFNLDHPYWVEDERFDIKNHVHHIRLPEPADWNEFCLLASRHATPTFNMNMPLWRMMVVEGLDNIEGLTPGSFAILFRMHHALVDGTSALKLLHVLHDLVPNIKPTQAKPNKAIDTSSIQKPSLLTQLYRAAINNSRGLVKLSVPALHGASRMGINFMRTGMLPVLGSSAKGPKTRFNQPVSSHRVFCTVSMPLNEIKPYRTTIKGATINDVVLSIVAGGVRRYLEAHKELPEDSLIALMPINTRNKEVEANSIGNNISFMRAPTFTNIADPIERLKRILRETIDAKNNVDAIGAKEMTDLTKFAPETTMAFVGRLVNITRFDAGQISKQPLFNYLLTNVPGPQQPLYLAGCELQTIHGITPVTDGLGLIFGVVSYNGNLHLSATSCPHMVSDPDLLGECIKASYDEIVSVGKTHQST